MTARLTYANVTATLALFLALARLAMMVGRNLIDRSPAAKRECQRARIVASRKNLSGPKPPPVQKLVLG